MEKIYNFLTNEEIKKVLETYPSIKNNPDIDKLLSILTNIGCNNDLISNIILSNPKYLTNDYLSVLELINKLYKLGLTNLYTIFESNPYLLNKSAYEIAEFIDYKLSEGKELEEVIDIIDSNPLDVEELI